ncbi:MAG: hypothetical protein JWO36_2525 [Myxococcales bacterium]|nr:hypothetical protein [Myxococcales bacterium]
MLMAVLARIAPSAADCAKPSETHILGFPVWATDPNEGTTWGVMPVLLRTCPADQRTEAILAPSVTWNSVIRYTGTLRLYAYPDEDSSLTVIASASTHINYRAVVEWQRAGTWTSEIMGRLQRSAFGRFYGIGPETPESAASSFTGRRAIASAREGRTFAGAFNIGLTLGVEHDRVEDIGVPGLPLAPEVFPDIPGMHGKSTLTWQGLDVRYDDRDGGAFASRGLRLQLSGAVVEGIRGTPSFLRAGADASGIVPELSWLSGAWRFHWSAVSSSEIPFYHQSELGGPFLLRGFADGRFVARQAWTVELEQRVRVLETHFFGVTTEWRIDPFVAAGQVFDTIDGAVSHPRLTAGFGFRAFVHPKTVARIDLATGGEGTNVYVEIGYPY